MAILSRRSSGTVPSSLISSAQLSFVDRQRIRQCARRWLTQLSLAALDCTDHRGADAGRDSELGLRQTTQHAPVARKAFIHGNAHQLGDRNIQRASNTGENVNLGRAHAHLPLIQRCSTHAGDASQLALGQASSRSSLRQGAGGEASQYSTAHGTAARHWGVIARHSALDLSSQSLENALLRCYSENVLGSEHPLGKRGLPAKKTARETGNVGELALRTTFPVPFTKVVQLC